MAGEDAPFVAWVRTLPCRVCRRTAGVQAHHAGPRAAGRRAHDDTCVPLCYACHHDWHAACGWARYLRKEQRREWAALAIEETRAAYARSVDVQPFPF